MTKENRFQDLMGAVSKNKNIQTSKSSDIQKSSSRERSIKSSNLKDSKDSKIQTSKSLNTQISVKAKSSDPNYTRATLYLPKKIHKKLKTIAVEEEREMSEIVEELISRWLDEK